MGSLALLGVAGGDSADGGVRGEPLEGLQRHPSDDRVVGLRSGDDEAAERLDLFFQLGTDVRADVDERPAMAVHFDGGGGGNGLAFRVAAAMVNRGQHLAIDLLLRHGAGVADAPICRRLALRARGGYDDHRREGEA